MLMCTRWTGFKIIGDNLGKNVYPSFMRLDCETKLLHYYHAYAALDRIDFSGLSESSPLGVIDVEKARFVSESELVQITADFCTLVSRYRMYCVCVYNTMCGITISDQGGKGQPLICVT